MDAITTIAISKAIDKKTMDASRPHLLPGEHVIDTTVRIVGTINVGQDEEATPTASLLNVDMMLLILKAAGVTRDHAMRTIEKVAGEYLAGWDGTDECKLKAEAARKEAVRAFDPEGKGAKAFKKFTGSLTKIPKSGKVKCNFKIMEIAGAKDIAVEEEKTIEMVG